MSYKVVYCAVIEDDKHEGLIKIGDTDFLPSHAVTTYLENDSELQIAANKRIRNWSGTAAAGARLIYCDILLRYNNITQNYETFRDYEIHNLVQSVGGYRVDFDSGLDSGREWFKTNLETVIAAIGAAKKGRDYLDTSELPEQQIYDLREEQKEAVEKTYKRFERAGDMLWHAKMRFGKTITALNLVKKEKYKRTIIITHRPVVEDSWGTDFYHVFSKDDKYAFLTKIDNNHSFNDDTTDEAIDLANDKRLERLLNQEVSVVYFASIQDLRGSKIVGGKYDKNKVVFETEWDLVIIDEAHEGTKTDLGQKVIDALIKEKTKKLDLSGTAYNLLDKYTDDKSVFTWDYVMEQDKKKHWSEKHPGEPNPYADMPTMHINTFSLEKLMKEKGLTLADKSFSFKEFFRTWTGDLSKDGDNVPDDSKIGDFVHEEYVNSFLDLLSKDSLKSRFPYATEEGCNQNIHTLWMVPGVKEAAALSRLLKKHFFFSNFGVANVAGEGDHDEETNFNNALKYVRKKIEDNPCTITLSCGRLTTGVTVKEWTSVFMLSGSEDTDAKQYMQTIFRVQSAGKVNGVQKTDCYVYDFAPDRALKVVAETAGTRRNGRTGTIIDDDNQHVAFSEFLSFCPVVAIDGAEFKKFSVQDLVSQINRVHIDRALRTGFMDNCIYDTSKFKALTNDELDDINDIFKKLKETKQKKPLKRAGMARNGLGSENGSRTNNGNNNSTDPSDNGSESINEKKFERELLERLRTISIRIPLLFYGGEFEIEDGRLGDVITGIDNASWNVFMPGQLSKSDFRKLVKYYNQETVIGAGKAIREKAKAADELPPTERTIAIAEIFSHFQNPSHETVLTPWRIVNMHMAITLGGYCFYNEKFQENSDDYYYRLQEPRLVNNDVVTGRTLLNPNAHILEINSKSGLYPLYAAYSLYRSKLNVIGKKESDCYPKELKRIWKEAVSQIYVVCQSPMSVQITKRTLCGYDDCQPHLKSEKNLVNTLQFDRNAFANKVLSISYWGNGGTGKMRFDAVIGNPPYQEETAVIGQSTNGQVPRRNIFHYFQMGADIVSSGYVSLIYPGGRWIHRSGKGLADFGKEQINDVHLSKIDFYPDASEIFSDVAIADGISVVFKDMNKTKSGFDYIYHLGDSERKTHVECPGDGLIPLNPQDGAIIKKVERFVSDNNLGYLSSRILPRSLFGIESNYVENNQDKVRDYISDELMDFENEVKLFTNDKAGKAGRAKWYVVKRDLIKTGLDYLDQWKVIVSSANAGGQKRDNQISIADNHSAFGRARVALGAFKTYSEAKNFYNFCRTKIIRFMFLMTDESLTSLGKLVPDLLDYSFDNELVDFCDDLDYQLFNLIGLDDNERNYIDEVLKKKAGEEPTETNENEE